MQGIHNAHVVQTLITAWASLLQIMTGVKVTLVFEIKGVEESTVED